MKTFKYSYNDFITGGEWNVPAKIDFYDLMVPKNGGWNNLKTIKDNIYKKYSDPHSAKRIWKKWCLRGSREIISSLTGFAKDSKEAKAIHQNIIEQFKTRFDEIYHSYGKFQKNSTLIFEEIPRQNSSTKTSDDFLTKLQKLTEFLSNEGYSEIKSKEIVKAYMSAS